MIRVEKPPLTHAEWLDATQKGLDRAAAHIAAFRARQPFEIDNALYKRFMAFLLEIFHGKCAYCEITLTNNQPGDVEHYRPKGRVVGDDLKPVKVRYDDLGEMEHPGYFWRAYDWDNLLPSCIDCNRRRNHLTVDGRVAAGKADRFPVKGPRARWAEEEAQEEPLLVNPSREDPAEHFVFNTDGTISARTSAGETTLDLLGLNTREGMIEARANAFDDATNAMGAFLDAAKAGDRPKAERQRQRVNRMWEGLEAHTVMHRMALGAVQANLSQYVPFPLPIPPFRDQAPASG